MASRRLSTVNFCMLSSGCAKGWRDAFAVFFNK